VPEDKLEVEIVSVVGGGGAITSERVTFWFCAGLEESTTLKVRLVVLVAFGVPEMTPAVDKLRPLGSVPEAMDQE
jgi:hypothetical protein